MNNSHPPAGAANDEVAFNLRHSLSLVKSREQWVLSVKQKMPPIPSAQTLPNRSRFPVRFPIQRENSTIRNTLKRQIRI